MCGIFGLYASPGAPAPTLELLSTMGEALRHRGPDDDGLLIDGRFGFGMRRLSIIDLKSGHQPVTNEDGSLHVVYNGEIYNYRELTQHLLERGHVFATTSDTEVIVHLFEEYGEQCLDRLRGMFAFAIWNARARTLFVARDRLGIKPLYYAQTPAGLVFASEVKSILRVPRVDRAVDPAALAAYLRYGYVPDPLAIFRGVRKLPPGHLFTAQDGAPVRVRRYWDVAGAFERASNAGSETDARDELRERLAQSVRAHLVSDVPLGAFLSGGIDSTTVVALMAAELGRSVKTFSIGFEDPAYNELPYARLASERLGTDHHELIVGGESVALIDQLVEDFDEPFADPSAIPTYLVSRLAAEHVKVVLSGDGGDEIFAGYDRYVVDHRRRRYDALSRLGLAPGARWVSRALPEGARGKEFLYNASLPRIERYLDSVSHYRPERLEAMLSADVRAELRRSTWDAFSEHVAASAALDYPSRLQYIDVKTYLPGDILTKVDRMSMAHSLEARVPLLDHELVEFVAALPSRLKLRGDDTKYLFKRVVRDVIPPEILRRPKHGFAVPLDRWFCGGLGDYLRERLLGAGALRHGLVNRSAVEALYATYRRTARPDCLQRLWTLVVFEAWHDRFVAR